MAKIYESAYKDPYPNGWKNGVDSHDTPIDADALQAMSDAIKYADTFWNGVNKEQIGQVRQSILTKEEWQRLPDTKYTNGVIYFITDGGTGISYPNLEEEAF